MAIRCLPPPTGTGTGTGLMQCLCCLEDTTADGSRACGFCDKRVCHACFPHLTEITEDAEADEDNGDVRCPNCRRSLLEGDLHARRKVIALAAPHANDAVVHDIVALEDLITRVLQLCAPPEMGEYFSVAKELVGQAIANDAQYTALLERLLGSQRTARNLRQHIRNHPTDRANLQALAQPLLQLLHSPKHGVGLTQAKARAILAEVAEQGLQNSMDRARYSAVWNREAVEDEAGPKGTAKAAAGEAAADVAAAAGGAVRASKRKR